MTAKMTKPTRRVTRSPEWLDLGGRTYSQQSACATTFLFVGKVVATSARPHATIINGVKGRLLVEAIDSRAPGRYWMGS